MDVGNSRHKNIAGFCRIQQENAGPSFAAHNTGLDASKGEYVQFFDSDDVLHCDKLSTQMSDIRQNQADSWVCNYHQSFCDTLSMLGQVVDTEKSDS